MFVQCGEAIRNGGNVSSCYNTGSNLKMPLALSSPGTSPLLLLWIQPLCQPSSVSSALTGQRSLGVQTGLPRATACVKQTPLARRMRGGFGELKQALKW